MAEGAALRRATWIGVVGGWVFVYVAHWQAVQPWGASAVFSVARVAPMSLHSQT